MVRENIADVMGETDDALLEKEVYGLEEKLSKYFEERDKATPFQPADPREQHDVEDEVDDYIDLDFPFDETEEGLPDVSKMMNYRDSLLDAINYFEERYFDSFGQFVWEY